MVDINYNLALKSNYRLELSNNKELVYFIQNTNIPSIDCAKVYSPHLNHAVYTQGETVEYEDLVIDFLINEDFVNYIFLHNWIITYRDNQPITEPDKMIDATLYIINNNKLSNIKFIFYGIFPTNLGSIDLNQANSDTENILCNATFAYQYFTIEK